MARINWRDHSRTYIWFRHNDKVGASIATGLILLGVSDFIIRTTGVRTFATVRQGSVVLAKTCGYCGSIGRLSESFNKKGKVMRITLATAIVAVFVLAGTSSAVTQPMAGNCPPAPQHCIWEQLGNRPDLQTDRASVPGGWLVRIRGVDGSSVTFLADPTHEWKAAEWADTGHYRAGPFIRLQLVVGGYPQPKIDPVIGPLCPCVWIDVRQLVAIQATESGQQGGSVAHTTAGDYAVWQKPEEIALYAQ
jgi:hypothetical protein